METFSQANKLKTELTFRVTDNMPDLVQQIRRRFKKVASHAQELHDPFRPLSNRDLIQTYGFNYFLELDSHRAGDPMVSTDFTNLFGRPADGKAEQMRHSRGLRRLENDGVIQLYFANEKSNKVKWCRLKFQINNK